RIALELAKEDPVYEGLATKFFQHYVYVAAAMKNMGNRDYQLWDEEDGFFYDVLNRPDGSFHKVRVRSLVGLIPIFAVERLEVDWIKPSQKSTRTVNGFPKNRRDLVKDVVHSLDRDGHVIEDPERLGEAVSHALTIVNPTQLSRLLQRVFD